MANNKNFVVKNGLDVGLDVTANSFIGDLVGTADTATALATSRTIALGGDLSGSASFDGSSNITITATVSDDSHNHIIANIDGLQNELDGKLDSSDIGNTVLAHDGNLQSFVNAFTLPTTDGSTGQVLTTNGAGTLSFTTVEGYTDADVDTHLNTSTAASGEVLSWDGTDYDWISAGATSINELSDGYSDGSSIGFGIGTLSNVSVNGNNIAIGVPALRGASSSFEGDYNIGLGYLTGDNLTSGSDNTFLGRYSGYATTIGSDNFLAGYFAGSQVTTSSNNIAIGREALRGDTTAKLTGSNNIGIGYQTGYDLSTGANNFLGGYQAGTNLTTGQHNVAIGNVALGSITTGGGNIAIGNGAGGDISTTSRSIFIGESAGSNASSGMGIGYRAARYSSVESNAAFGKEALSSTDLSGGENIAIGLQALRNTTSGAQNTGVGHIAGSNITTGSNNLALGNGAQASSATVSNEITLGNSSITRFRIPGIQSGASDGDVLTYNSSSGILELQAPPSPALYAENPSSQSDPTATGSNAVAIGDGASSVVAGKYAYASGRFISSGDAQSGKFVLRADTSSDTPEALTTNNSSAGIANQIILPNNSAYFFSGTIIARQQAADGTDVGAWEIKGAIRREGSAGTTVLVNSTIDEFNVPIGWDISLSEDTTNGGLQITVTGAASTDIRWVADINTTEVTYS